MERKIRTLEADEIEVRINQVGEKGASALLYKTARVDYEILDETFGIGNWSVDYSEIKGNLFCTVSIWDEDKKQWIRKQNCGVESREDGNGNEKKGEASDAMKRAGTVVGIGRELYSSPFVFLKVETEKDKNGRWQLKDRFAKFAVSEIGYDNKRKINRLSIVNQKTGEVLYRFGANAPASRKPKTEAPKEQPKAEVKAEVSQSEKVPDFDYKAAMEAFMESYKITRAEFATWKAKASQDPNTGITTKLFKELAPEEWREMIIKMYELAQNGYFEVKDNE